MEREREREEEKGGARERVSPGERGRVRLQQILCFIE